MTPADEFLDRLLWLLETRGQGRYDERVTQLEHALQGDERPPLDASFASRGAMVPAVVTAGGPGLPRG